MRNLFQTDKPTPMTSKKLHLLGVSSCYGAGDQHCDLAPQVLQQQGLESYLQQQGLDAHWHCQIRPQLHSTTTQALDYIKQTCTELAQCTAQLVGQQQQFTVVGGDHSIAIGTWSGVNRALQTRGESLGLIWIDAHMDAHTPQTSPSGNIHGMPVACLLGTGYGELTNEVVATHGLAPAQLVIIGVRSFEPEEADFLLHKGVKVIHNEEVKRQGIAACLWSAVDYLQKQELTIGVSIDLDAIDPLDAPGVGSPASDGISAESLLAALPMFSVMENFVGLEIVELNPRLDDGNQTVQLTFDLIRKCFL